MKFSPPQILAALAMAGLSETAFAELIGMDRANLSKVLSGKVTPREETQRKIIRTLEDHAIEFQADGGVRPRTEFVKIYEGVEGYQAFADDRYMTAINSTQDFLTCLPDPKELSIGLPKEISEFHRQRLRDLPHYKIRGLRALENTKDLLNTDIQFRALPRYELPPSFYVYGNKYAVLRFMPDIRIIVITDRGLADQWRAHFENMWDRAAELRA